MNSLDEFQLLESMLKKSEDSLMKHQRKKHKTDLVGDMETIHSTAASSDEDDDDDTGGETDFLELEGIVKSVLSSQSNDQGELKKRDEIIKKLIKRLYHERQVKEEAKQSENLVAEQLEDIKHQMKHIPSQVNKYKDSIMAANKVVKSSECQTELPSQPTPPPPPPFNLEASFELARRQPTPNHSTIFLENNNTDQQQHSSAKSTLAAAATNGNANCDPNFEKMLLDQIKVYEEKIQAERLSYIEENERLSRVIEENTRIIEELKCQVRRSSNRSSTLTSTSSTKNSSNLSTFIDADDSGKDYSSRVQGYSSTTNNRMLHVLSDLVKTFLDTENDIQKQLETLGLENKSTRHEDNGLLGFPSLEDERISDLTFDGLCDDGPDLTPSSMVYSSHSLNATSSDIEDDVVLGASRRLRLAVERVLKILTEVVDHHSQHDLKELLKEKEELTLELQEEVQRRDQLTRQLLEKESALHCLENEKRILVERTADYGEIKAEREQLKLKLEEYERDRDKFLHDHKRFESEKSTFSQGLPQLQQKLMRENETLNRDVHQLQQDKMNLMKRINSLTAEVETLKSEKDQVIEAKNAEFEELISQIEANEKNLSSLKRFVEEQTQEREFEREEYNKEVAALKEKLKEKEKAETKLKSNIRSLESQVSFLNEDKTLRDEQIEAMTVSLKEANLKVAELNLVVRQLETDMERNSQVEVELRAKLKELSSVLNIKLNDEANWQDLLSAIAKVAEAKQQEETAPGRKSARVIVDVVDGQSDLSSASGSGSSADNSVFLAIKLMDDKIRLLNNQVDGLLEKNGQLKEELRQTNEVAAKLEEIKAEMEGVERILHETQKENEMLHQEINDNHMKYSELKVKLESSVDVNEFKRVVNELQAKLQTEKQHTESVTVKLEQANRHVGELDEKLDAYKKEIKSYKELIKSHEVDSKHSKDKGGELKGKYEAALLEVNQLNTKLANKEKTVAILEQNIEMLKSKLSALVKEKDVYFEKLQSVGDSQNKVVIYEKNLEKLRLQNKMSCDKITYLELEIKSLKKKIDILERENDFLKMENQKLLKLRAEVSAAMSESEDNVDSLSVAMNPNCNGNLYLNGLDKINSISSNNLLMLKVRRLLSQKGALIYQKNYLIHLLGGFQMTENATLALLSNLNHTKDIEECIDGKMRGKQKFRSVAYALIALSRMRYMVNIWQCRKRQLLLSKTAHSISSNLQNLPVPPKKMLSSGTNSVRSASSSASSSPVHFAKHPALSSQISSTMKDYVDRLHVVHETLGLHTNKL